MTVRVLPQDHPHRLPLTEELHARPFSPLSAPTEAVQFAFKPVDDRIRDTSGHREHLAALIDRFGAPPAAKDSPHYYGEAGSVKLRWEQHTEFVSYTIYREGGTATPFSEPIEKLAPADWLAEAPGALISAIRLHIEATPSPDAAAQAIHQRFHRFFVPESTAAALVAEAQATVIGDFRIHEDGLSRFAILTNPMTGSRRLGRIVQRLIEIENYRLLAMLALPMARDLGGRLNTVEAELAALTGGLSTQAQDDRATLAELTRLSGAIEAMSAETAFRFAASNAYAALVEQRIAVLREVRAADRQTLSEFMARRFSPAMRTCAATERRLKAIAERASSAVRLLGARVNVAVETQNQALLESMNRRAELQLRLQHTVEGLSVVAISYYAVSLTAYFIAPFAGALGVDKATSTALLTIPVIFVVWSFVRRLRKSLEKVDHG